MDKKDKHSEETQKEQFSKKQDDKDVTIEAQSEELNTESKICVDFEKEKIEIEDKYIRLQAEFDNYRKRSSKDRIEFIKFANEGLIIELLEILDNFERGIKAAESKKDFDLLHQGVDMISKQLHVLLEAKGLVKIKSVGEKFNPHYHEAVEVIAGGGEKDMISEEMQPGYLLNGRIIRPARVKVAKGKNEEMFTEDKDGTEKEIDANQRIEEDKI